MYFALFEILFKTTQLNTIVFSYTPRLFIASGLHGDVIVSLGHIHFVKSKKTRIQLVTSVYLAVYVNFSTKHTVH